MADDLVVREWTEDEKYYVPVPYWEMYNVVARAHLAVVAERDARIAGHQRVCDAYREVCAELDAKLTASEAARVTGDGLLARLMASEAVLRVAAEEVDVMLDNARHRLRQALAPVKEPSNGR